MSYILNIDTALETASICLAREEEVLAYAENGNQKDHSQWLHVAIEQLLNTHKITAADLTAIAVCTGPGSYTGLRVGLSAAKGFCYALNKPLLTISNLLLTAAVQSDSSAIICPCIDARRMEVYFSTFDKELHEIQHPSSLIVTPDSFNDLLESGPVLFCGNGAYKIQSIIQHPNAIFSQTLPTAKNMVLLSLEKFRMNHFDDLVTAEPLYIKPFYTTMQGV